MQIDTEREGQRLLRELLLDRSIITALYCFVHHLRERKERCVIEDRVAALGRRLRLGSWSRRGLVLDGGRDLRQHDWSGCFLNRLVARIREQPLIDQITTDTSDG